MNLSPARAAHLEALCGQCSAAWIGAATLPPAEARAIRALLACAATLADITAMDWRGLDFHRGWPVAWRAALETGPRGGEYWRHRVLFLPPDVAAHLRAMPRPENARAPLLPASHGTRLTAPALAAAVRTAQVAGHPNPRPRLTAGGVRRAALFHLWQAGVPYRAAQLFLNTDPAHRARGTFDTDYLLAERFSEGPTAARVWQAAIGAAPADVGAAE